MMRSQSRPFRMIVHFLAVVPVVLVLFGAGTALSEGEFYTDVYGDFILPSSDPGAVRQYVEPGFSLGFFKNATANRIECVARDPWIFDYTCYQIGGAGNLEHLPHVPNMNIEESLRTN